MTTGAVYLYSFTDSTFSGGNLEAIAGSEFQGTKDIDQYLDSGDHFGTSVSLNNNRLAVGADEDDGYNNAGSDIGAVYLYSFEDSDFNGGSLKLIIGDGYGKSQLYPNLDNGDYFGSAVSLDGNSLAIGAKRDDSYNNSNSRSGAVYLYSFDDNYFNGGRIEGIIGIGYTGGKNINPNNLSSNDYFGTSVSLNNNRLAVGAEGDDGFGDSNATSGAVYLYSFTDSVFSGGNL